MVASLAEHNHLKDHSILDSGLQMNVAAVGGQSIGEFQGFQHVDLHPTGGTSHQLETIN